MANNLNRSFLSLPSPPNTGGIERMFTYIKDLHRDLENIISLISGKLNGSVNVFTKTIVSDYDVSRSKDFLILADASSGDINVNLPDVFTAKNTYFIVKKIDSGANTVTVSSTQNIDGVSTKVLVSQWDKISLISDGEQWYTV